MKWLSLISSVLTLLMGSLAYVGGYFLRNSTHANTIDPVISGRSAVEIGILTILIAIIAPETVGISLGAVLGSLDWALSNVNLLLVLDFCALATVGILLWVVAALEGFMETEAAYVTARVVSVSCDRVVARRI